MINPRIDYKAELLAHRMQIGVWGSGYIGYTSAINFAMNGVAVLCYDTNLAVVDAIRDGHIHIPNLEYWLGFPVSDLVKSGILTATTDWHRLCDPTIKIHLIAVPTERAGEPWDEPLFEVLSKITVRPPNVEVPDVVVIESTLTPATLDRKILPFLKDRGFSPGEDLLLGIAPRRDWFHSPEKNLKNLPRIVAGTTPESTKPIQEILSIVCDHLIPASDHRIAELVKPVENSLLHIPVVYAMQLARAYPQLDITEVLKLAATHWRIPLYYPSVGTGGYCIPVSSKYVILGAEQPQHLTLAEAALSFDAEQSRFIASQLIGSGIQSVGILGICYKGDLKVHTLSPALAIIKRLRQAGLEVKTHDPYYQTQELLEITGCQSFCYPNDLAQFEALILIPDHRLYAQTPNHLILQNLTPGAIIVDNLGVWAKHRDRFQTQGFQYRKIGDPDWTSFPLRKSVARPAPPDDD